MALRLRMLPEARYRRSCCLRLEVTTAAARKARAQQRRGGGRGDNAKMRAPLWRNGI